jgi:glycosyltransferase involved in cell wall biosynthesis
MRWQSRLRLYKQFEEHMLDSGVNLTTVECAYGDRPYDLGDNKHVNYIHARASGMALAWNKEVLWNRGIYSLPDEARYVATLDADIEFLDKDWATETVHALQHFHVIQPWSVALDHGPGAGGSEHMQVHKSFFSLWQAGKLIMQGPNVSKSYYEFGHPGYGFAWTRDALTTVGCYPETAALGACDHHVCLGVIGRIQDSIPNNISDAYKKPLFQWQEFAKPLKANAGALGGTIRHFWHGSKVQRKYVDRWDVLIKHDFDPTSDLKRNSHGVLELAGNKPGLRDDLLKYFGQRFEDANCL